MDECLFLLRFGIALALADTNQHCRGRDAFMAQIFGRGSNALARMILILSGVMASGLGGALYLLQSSPWVTRQGLRPEQPVPFSHKHHVQGLGVQCQYCHGTVEGSSYAGIPPTKTCMNCHAQLWTNANLLQPVRASWATGRALVWIKVHDLPDFVYFNHEIHVNKGIGCASCHGRVDQMPLMYAQNSLQMQWCLDCHRNPAKNLRPTSEIYNMAWEKPSRDRPVWCAAGDEKSGVPTAESVNCVTKEPGVAELASLEIPTIGAASSGTTAGLASSALPLSKFKKFTSQDQLGGFLVEHYRIRSPRELTSCEVCHR
jgi:hypothetical protein